jgi:hypothetical protein
VQPIPVGALTLQGYAPSVLGEGAIAPGAGELRFTGYAPTLQTAFVQAIPA